MYEFPCFNLRCMFFKSIPTLLENSVWIDNDHHALLCFLSSLLVLYLRSWQVRAHLVFMKQNTGLIENIYFWRTGILFVCCGTELRAARIRFYHNFILKKSQMEAATRQWVCLQPGSIKSEYSRNLPSPAFFSIRRNRHMEAVMTRIKVRRGVKILWILWMQFSLVGKIKIYLYLNQRYVNEGLVKLN